jgi:hypothetical protein
MNKVTRITNMPTLDELIADSSRARAVSPEEAIGLLSRMASIQPVLLAVACSDKVENEPAGDRLLKVREVAYRLNCDPDWVYRNTDKLPFTRRLSSSQLRFSEKGLEKYIKNLPRQLY